MIYGDTIEWTCHTHGVVAKWVYPGIIEYTFGVKYCQICGEKLKRKQYTVESLISDKMGVY